MKVKTFYSLVGIREDSKPESFNKAEEQMSSFVANVQVNHIGQSSVETKCWGRSAVLTCFSVWYEETRLSKLQQLRGQPRELLNQPIESLDLPTRPRRVLAYKAIKTLGDLCEKTEPELMGYRNLGKKSLDEIREKLLALGFHLGMQVPRR